MKSDDNLSGCFKNSLYLLKKPSNNDIILLSQIDKDDRPNLSELICYKQSINAIDLMNDTSKAQSCQIFNDIIESVTEQTSSSKSSSFKQVTIQDADSKADRSILKNLLMCESPMPDSYKSMMDDTGKISSKVIVNRSILESSAAPKDTYQDERDLKSSSQPDS